MTDSVYSGLDRILRNLAGSSGQAGAEINFPGRGHRLGGDGTAGTQPPNVRPVGAAAGGFKGFTDSVADMYHRMDPQLKVLCGVVLLYVVIQAVF